MSGGRSSSDPPGLRPAAGPGAHRQNRLDLSPAQQVDVFTVAVSHGGGGGAAFRVWTGAERRDTRRR